MAFRRPSSRRRPFRFGRGMRRRRNPLRTRAVKDTLWNVCNIVSGQTFTLSTPNQNIITSVPLVSPKLMLESQTSLLEPITGALIQNVGPYELMKDAHSGFLVGGIVWQAQFIVTSTSFNENTVNAWAECRELLVTEHTDNDGFPTPNLPVYNWPWRPLATGDTVILNPPTSQVSEHALRGSLVRIHHDRCTYLPCANNWATYASTGDTGFGLSQQAGASPFAAPKSLRLRHFVSEDRSLSLHLNVRIGNFTPDGPIAIGYNVTGHYYWKLAR